MPATPATFHHHATRYDALIVGARAAGASTAMLLARRGHRVLVVDRARYGSDTLSTHALMRGGVLQLARWGLLDRIADGTQPVRRAIFHLPGGDVEVPIKPSGGIDALYAPRRTLLDRVLVDAAVEAGADVRFGVTVTDLTTDGSGRVTGLVGRHADGGQLTATGHFTVGADGVRSLVARRTGARTERTGRATAMVFGYFTDMPGDAYRWAFRDGGFAGVIPTDGDSSVVFAGTNPRRFRTEVAGDLAGAFRRLLHEASPDLAAALQGREPPAPLRGYPGIPGHVRRAHGPGWVLVGDSGYWKDPIGAHGLTQSMRDAELAARAIDAALTGTIPEEVALDTYQRTRDELSEELFTVVDELAGLEWSADGASRLLRDLSEAARPETALLAGLDAPTVAAAERSA